MPEHAGFYRTILINFIIRCLLGHLFYAMEIYSEHQLDFVSTPSEIIRELINSRDNGNVIGITALSLGPAMVMTAVEEIIDVRNDKIIALKELDLLGTKIPETEILLSEIAKVHLFSTHYDDPFHVQLREHKKEY